MQDRDVDQVDCDALEAEITRLRSDIAQLEDRVRHLDQLAHRDALIDLPNRRGFMRHLDDLIARVERYDDSAAMLYVDVDGLKLINDSFGHKAGDEALIYVAELLVAGVRKSDYVARLGGDEFGILLERADDDSAQETASRLGAQVADCEFCYDGTCLPLSVAIGVSMIGKGDTREAVMERADHAMYREKAAA